MRVREVRATDPLDAFPTRNSYCADRELSLQYLGETVLVSDLPNDLTDLSLAGLRCIVDTRAAFVCWSGVRPGTLTGGAPAT
eukprot:11202598-Lingulodinium_polyedra.AAC.1